MGFSTGDGFRLGNGKFLSRAFLNALAINAVVAFVRAGSQEYQEDQGQVVPDNLNFAQDAVVNFVWDNPRDLAVKTYEVFTAPE